MADHRIDIDAVKNPVQLLGRKSDNRCLAARPSELVLGQPLQDQHKAGPIEEQQLHPVATAIAERKNRRSERIEREVRVDPVFERKSRDRNARLKAGRHKTLLRCRLVTPATVSANKPDPQFLIVVCHHKVSTYLSGHLMHQSTQKQKVRRNSRLLQSGAAAEADRGGWLRAKVSSFAKAFAGHWRIVEMDNWDSDLLDLVEEAHLTVGGKSDGKIAFGALKGFLDVSYGSRDGSACAEFSWEGHDENDSSCGRGWAMIGTASRLVGHLYIHNGDDSAFVCERGLVLQQPARCRGMAMPLIARKVDLTVQERSYRGPSLFRSRFVNGMSVVFNHMQL